VTNSASSTNPDAHPGSDPSRKGVIWDMDGTLIDSAQQHYEAWRELLAPEGVDLDYPGFLVGFGRRNDEWLREMLGEEIHLTEIRRIGAEKEARYRELVAAEGLVVLPGVVETLEALRARGWKHAIATSAPLQNLEIILDVTGLKEYMDAWAGSEDVERGKPAPDIFLVAAERIGVVPERAVVVEDAAAGVLGAHRAGMVAIGVGSHHDELGADRSAASLVDLPIETFSELVGTTSRRD
jgi:HAD superfamily hydrolase (TIGR01509 family)